MEPVKIELNEEDLKGKTDSEKLDTLIKIAFSNHEQLLKQGLILFGNGNPEKGLCHQVAYQGKFVKWVVGVGSFIGAGAIGMLTSHLLK
jgi:hypothetical protein